MEITLKQIGITSAVL